MRKGLSKSTSNNKSFVKTACNATTAHDNNKPDDYTCYSIEQLQKMKIRWNARHPDVPIIASDKKGIWDALHKHNKKMCNTESCWIEQEFMKYYLDNKFKQHTFAPKRPLKWDTNPVEWLTSTNITDVMRQYEYRYNDFEFIGPAPIDFDDRKGETECVWDELCNFSVDDYLNRGKYMIGIVFNTDPHYKSGSHWISLFIDLRANRKFVYFFDSNGDKCPHQIDIFRKRVVDQAKIAGITLQYNSNTGIQHQRQNTECGIYCLYFMTTLLSGKHDPTTFTNKRIPDELMEQYRSVFFS